MPRHSNDTKKMAPMTNSPSKKAPLAVVLLIALILTACGTMRNTNSTKAHSETSRQTTGTSDRQIEMTVTEAKTDSGETITTEAITTTYYSEPDTAGRQYVIRQTTNQRETRKQTNAKTHTNKQLTATAKDSLRTDSRTQSAYEHRDSTIEMTGSTQPDGRSAYDIFTAWGFWILLGIFILTIIIIILWIYVRR